MHDTDQPDPRPAAAIVDPRIAVRPSTLADGRELIYFDDADTHAAGRARDRRARARPAPRDRRTCARTRSRASGSRSRRPARTASSCRRPTSTRSHRSGRANPSEIPSTYDVAVFENRSPSFGPELAAPDASSADALADAASRRASSARATSVGRCEVVCFSPEHEGSFGTLSVSRARTVIEAWAAAHRRALGAARRRAGVPVREPRARDRRHAAAPARPDLRLPLRDAAHRATARRDPTTTGPRSWPTSSSASATARACCSSGEHWTAFVPFAARWPIEVHLLPHRHVPDFAETTLAERDELASLYLRLLRGVDRLYDTPTPYIAAWHQAPVHERSRRGAAHAAAHEPAPGRRQAEVPRRLRGRDGSMDRGRRPRGAGRVAAPRDRRGRRHERGRRGDARIRRMVRARAHRRVVGARSGEPHRRAHRLQRRVRVPLRDRPAHRRRARRSRRPGRCASPRASPPRPSRSTSTS